MTLLQHSVKFGVWVHNCILAVVAHVLGVSQFQCVIWASVIPRFFQNWLESLWLIWSLDVHLSIFVDLDRVNIDSLFLWLLLMYVCRLCVAHVCVSIGIPLSQYGVVWDVCIRGVLVGFFRRIPSFAKWSTTSLPIIPVCALTSCIVFLCVDQVIWVTMVGMHSLSGWLCWDDGCRIWLFIKYILLRLFVNTKVSCV